jgi:hypothetical protein
MTKNGIPVDGNEIYVRDSIEVCLIAIKEKNKDSPNSIKRIRWYLVNQEENRGSQKKFIR